MTCSAGFWQEPGAVFNTPEALAASEHFNDWVEAGYFQSDVNAIDYTTHVGQFVDGEGLFLFIGDWESANLDAQMGNNVGFFLVPPLEAGGDHVAMSAPATFGMAAASSNTDAAAFFLNWAHTDPKARRIIIEIDREESWWPSWSASSSCGGNTCSGDDRRGAVLGADDGAISFIASATGAILSEVLTPELQKLFAIGRQTPQGLIDEIQEGYERAGILHPTD